jgi:hypothetical protein
MASENTAKEIVLNFQVLNPFIFGGEVVKWVSILMMIRIGALLQLILTPLAAQIIILFFLKVLSLG